MQSHLTRRNVAQFAQITLLALISSFPRFCQDFKGVLACGVDWRGSISVMCISFE